MTTLGWILEESLDLVGAVFGFWVHVMVIIGLSILILSPFAWVGWVLVERWLL